MNEALVIYPNIISKSQNNVWLGKVRSLITPIFSYIFAFFLLSFPPTPNPLPSGKRPLRFASPGFSQPAITFVTLAAKRGSILSLPFTYRLFGSACLKAEELRWGSPTATPPLEPLDFAHSLKSPSRMRRSILGIYHPGGDFHPSATNIGQFGKLTDRIERTPVPELVEGGYLLSALKSQRGEIGIARGGSGAQPRVIIPHQNSPERAN